MNAPYKIGPITRTSAHVVITADRLDDRGAKIPGSTLQLMEPKGSTTYADLEPDDVVTLKITKAKTA